MEYLIGILVNVLKYYVIITIVKFLWKKRESIPIFLSTIGRDVWLLYVWYGKILFSWMGRKRRNETICKSLDKIVKESGADRACFYFGDEIWTYKQVQEMSFRVANYFQGLGFQKGDVVGLAMTNRPEVIAIWLGLGRIGGVTVIINTNLRGESLEKCISVVKCKAFIIGTEVKQAFSDICYEGGSKFLPADIYELDRFIEDPKWEPKYLPTQLGNLNTVDFAQCLLKTRKEPTSVPKGQEPTFLDPLLYVFTSGTTGVPKAVRCSHGRLFFLASMASVINFSTKDISYNSVPMYHIGGSLAVVWAFCYEAPCVLAVKFSPSNFWKDVHRYKVMVCIYVAEFCRLLVNQPVCSELEKGHSLRAMFGGGGLRPEVWAAFKERFKVKTVLDFYTATEGNCTMLNLEGKIEACGYTPIWLQPIHPIQLVKVDEISGKICRDRETGFAIKCSDGQPGELVGKIVDSIPMTRFDGYTDREATEKKIVRNVFCKGDKYFRSGDTVTRDKYGYYYFRDRIGDTFRWNGENVATTLVEGVISRLTGMRNNVVYGVKVPGTEGTAGMAAILDSSDGDFDIQNLTDGMIKSLPRYAMPMFIRLVNNRKGLDMTGTYKFQKFQLKVDGFDMEQIEDPIFIYSCGTASYRKMDVGIFKEVMRGNYRF